MIITIITTTPAAYTSYRRGGVLNCITRTTVCRCCRRPTSLIRDRNRPKGTLTVEPRRHTNDRQLQSKRSLIVKSYYTHIYSHIYDMCACVNLLFRRHVIPPPSRYTYLYLSLTTSLYLTLFLAHAVYIKHVITDNNRQLSGRRQ